jgi:hypothetical protein
VWAGVAPIGANYEIHSKIVKILGLKPCIDIPPKEKAKTLEELERQIEECRARIKEYKSVLKQLTPGLKQKIEEFPPPEELSKQLPPPPTGGGADTYAELRKQLKSAKAFYDSFQGEPLKFGTLFAKFLLPLHGGVAFIEMMPKLQADIAAIGIK